MKVVGIIAEYNPFHNGHKYQIEELKKKTDADYVVIAMSGNFLQRGVPAICSKYERAHMALACGADLVLELPVIWATASAEYFAHGGVHLLKNTGVITHLCFGAETDKLDALCTVSSILREEPPYYKEALSTQLKEGKPFPIARKDALLSSTCELSASLLKELLATPNNILALEYLKILPETITPVLIQRKGAGYHDSDITCALPSATAIRDTLLKRDGTITQNDSLLDAMPSEAYAILQKCVEAKSLMDCEDLSDILGYRLLSLEREGFAEFADSSQELSNKITNQLKNYSGFHSFCQVLKTKDLTYTRISRLLLHILLNIKHEDYNLGKNLGYSPYLRVLGFRKDSTPLLNAIKKEACAPLITKVADAASILSPEAYSIFEKDLYASSIYNQLLAIRKNQSPANDYTSQIIIL